MENATKALLIAGSMLLAVMLISLLVMGYNRISSHYEQQHELLTAEQLDKFNKQFQNYKRSDIRGNELISLMNKVIDYNASQAYQEGTNYEPIKVTITIGDSLVGEFRYEDDNSGARNIVNSVITNTSGPSYSNDRSLVAITGTPADLIEDAKTEPSLLPKSNDVVFTDTQLQKLTAEISNIMIDENVDGINPDGTNWSEQQKYRAVENRRNRAVILRNILRWKWAITDSGATDYDLLLNKDTYITQTNENGIEKIKKIKEIVSRYYQYTQFKRACFECVEITHNQETGRVNGMKFEVQTKTKIVNGEEKVTVVFD